MHEECWYESIGTRAAGHDQWSKFLFYFFGHISYELLQVEKKGVIYFEDVCKLILRKFREDDEHEFIKIMFKVSANFCNILPSFTMI